MDTVWPCEMRDKKLVDVLLSCMNWIDLRQNDYLLNFSCNFNTDFFRWLSVRRHFPGAHIQYSVSVLLLIGISFILKRRRQLNLLSSWQGWNHKYYGSYCIRTIVRVNVVGLVNVSMSNVLIVYKLFNFI